MLPILIGVWITITTPVQLYNENTVILVAEFQTTVDDSYLMNINNFSLVDGASTPIPIQSVQLLDTLDSIPADYTKLLAMTIPRPGSKKEYMFTANGYGDYWFYDYGFGGEIIPGDITPPRMLNAEIISKILEGTP